MSSMTTTENNEDFDPTNIKIRGEIIQVDNLWACYNDSIGYGGMDVAAYVDGGMSIWPCGRIFQKKGYDDFNEDTGVKNCTCTLCNKVRDLLHHK